jgi:glycerol-3-phosphate cytidylyltransferase-like family protein
MAALQHGNRLFVGVLSDESVAAYKRKPVMTMKERAEVVATCKGVYKVILDAPCPGIPEEFLRKWNIHVVCLSTEYDKPDDVYYAIPRKLGITRVLPRTDGISTSDLIKVNWVLVGVGVVVVVVHCCFLQRVKMYGEESKQKF